LNKTFLLIAASAVLLAQSAANAANAANAAERVMAHVTCAETKTKLVFDCRIMLMGRKSRKPIQGAKVRIKADMPAMPMAHNVRPVTAMAMGKPGMYHAKLHLEMYGEWALKMTVTGPNRDIVIRKHRFGTVKAGGGHMGHGSKKKMNHNKN